MFGSITVIPQFLSSLPLYGSNNEENVFGVGLVIGLLLLTIGIYFFILRLFVFKTAWLIDKLQLNKGFEEDKLDFNVRLTTILTVSTIVIGGLMFVDGFPKLCK